MKIPTGNLTMPGLVRKDILCALLFFAMSALQFAEADNVSWNKPNETGYWSDPDNWSTSALPKEGDIVNIENGGNVILNEDSFDLNLYRLLVGNSTKGYLEINEGSTLSAVNNNPYDPTTFYVGASSGSDGEVKINGGTLNANGYAIIGGSGTGKMTIESGTFNYSGGLSVHIGYNQGGIGTFTVNGGEFIASADWDVVSITVGSSGKGDFVVNNDGKATINALVWIGGSQYSSGGTGTMSINDSGTLISRKELVVGSYGGKGYLNINDDASATIRDLYISHNNNSEGYVVVNGGTLDITKWLLVAYDGKAVMDVNGGNVSVASTTWIGNNAAANGVLNMSGGTFNAKNIALAANGIGELNVNGGLLTASEIKIGVNSGSKGTLNLNGGVLEAAKISNGSGVSFMNFNGGTLRASAAAASNFIVGISDIFFNGKGGAIDSNGLDIIINANLTGTGVLNKNGLGGLTLGGLGSTNSGGININGGSVTAASENALGRGVITVNDGTSLLSAVENVSVGGIRLNSGGTFDVNGVQSAGSFTLAGDFIMDGGLYKLTIISETEFDRIIGGGAFFLNEGTVSLVNLGIDYDKTYQIFDGFDYGEVDETSIAILGYDQLNYTAHISDEGVLWFENVPSGNIPEPSVCGIILSAASVCALALKRRRKQSTTHMTPQ